MQRYICIHGHFYQPPRESPWLEEIEVQDSAYPYHDWNERISAECYEPNTTSRILDGDGRIVDIVNNYASMSFNFGPTLLSWLENHAPETYRRILEADRQSAGRFSGHGSALAQVYNHVIMPLANRRDKVTQVRWGIRDFKHRWGRMPEGMWLAETAVDTETLGVLADHGVTFTILAPTQAREVRKYRGRNWQDVSGGHVDPTKPYLVRLPSRRKIAVFFYDGPISQGIAFEGLLAKGENLAERLAGAFNDDREWPQLVHIATDGETYGHHHRHGDMALAYALHHIRETNIAEITNYGQYLEHHPPVDEARIHENSSWSCVHGVERWRSDCGCNSGGYPGWNQRWRAPLREALDWLRDRLAPLFDELGGRLFTSPWAARDGYIDVILDRSPETLHRFFENFGRRLPDASDTSRALVLLEMQRQCLLMYTSCGWFFDELSGIETVQVLHYAARAIQLAEHLSHTNLEADFCERLAAAKSNLPQHVDGREIYCKWVKPAVVELENVGAHFAVSSLFEDYKQKNKVFAYSAEVDDFHRHQMGLAKLAVGSATIASDVTRLSAKFSFGVIHWGDQNLHGGIRAFSSQADYARFAERVVTMFEQGDYTAIVGLLDREFHASTYSLRSLFRDEQRKILNLILDSGPAEKTYRDLYQRSAPLLHFLASLEVPRPQAFRTAAEFILNVDLRRALQGELDQAEIDRLLKEVRVCGVQLDAEGLSYALSQRIVHSLPPHDDHLHAAQIEEFEMLIAIAQSLPFDVDLRPAQNRYFELARATIRNTGEGSQAGDGQSRELVELFGRLGERLGVRVQPYQAIA